MADETKTEATGFKLPDPAEIGRSMADIAERSQRIVSEWLKRQATEEHAPDPLNIGSAFMEMTARLMANPAQTGAGTARLLAGLHDALAEHRAAHDGHAEPSR